MKYCKLAVLGLLVVLQVPTQAAVYGTLKQDIKVNVAEDRKVIKLAGEDISILEEDENNYLILIEEDVTQYISKNFVELPGIISETINLEVGLLEEADNKSTVLRSLTQNTVVMVLERQDEFYKVKVDGIVGYIHEQEIDQTGLEKIVDKSSPKQKGEEIVAYAKQFLGGRYVYGGNSLKSGVDCSGFTQQIMKQFDINIERSSRMQYSTNGYKVSVDDILPGDLVFYGTNGRVDHVAIYAGDGEIVHASDVNTGIKMGSLYYGKSLIGVKRVIK